MESIATLPFQKILAKTKAVLWMLGQGRRLEKILHLVYLEFGAKHKCLVSSREDMFNNVVFTGICWRKTVVLEADESKSLLVLPPLPLALQEQQGAPGSFEGPAEISWNSSTAALLWEVHRKGKLPFLNCNRGFKERKKPLEHSISTISWSLKTAKCWALP